MIKQDDSFIQCEHLKGAPGVVIFYKDDYHEVCLACLTQIKMEKLKEGL